MSNEKMQTQDSVSFVLRGPDGQVKKQVSTETTVADVNTQRFVELVFRLAEHIHGEEHARRKS